MTAKTRILVALQQAAHPVCDDCLAVVASLSSRQIAYAIGTALAKQGAIDPPARSVRGMPQD